jgi:hypothetical protein
MLDFIRSRKEHSAIYDYPEWVPMYQSVLRHLKNLNFKNRFGHFFNNCCRY